MITYESDKLKQLIPNLDKESVKAFTVTLRHLAEEVRGNLIELSPVGKGWDAQKGAKTPHRHQGGQLAKRWESHKENELRYVIDNPTPYLPFVVGGTGTHGEGKGWITIVPKNVKWLRWFDQSGNAVFAKKVMNPGIKPNPFIKDALEKAEGRLDQFIDIGFKEAGLV
jgi:hypothetical protein